MGQFVVMLVGLVLTLTGLVLVFQRPGEGRRNRVKVFGVEADLSTGVVVLAIGAAIFVTPIVLPYFGDSGTSEGLPTADGQNGQGESTVPEDAGPTVESPASPARPEETSSALPDCLGDHLAGLPPDRIARIRVEGGEQVVARRVRDADRMAILIEESGAIEAAIIFKFIKGDLPFNLESVVSSECRGGNTRNINSGGDGTVAHNYDTIELQFEKRCFSVDFEYDAGIVSADKVRDC